VRMRGFFTTFRMTAWVGLEGRCELEERGAG
jgi:hypothetical protein